MKSEQISYVCGNAREAFVDNTYVPTADIPRYLRENGVTHLLFDSHFTSEDLLVKILKESGVANVYVCDSPLKNTYIRVISRVSMYNLVSHGSDFVRNIATPLINPRDSLFLHQVSL